jgi:hypothetical protein
MVIEWLMWVKQCHKPAMTGNGSFIPLIKMVMIGGGFMALFYPHYLTMKLKQLLNIGIHHIHSYFSLPVGMVFNVPFQQ